MRVLSLGIPFLLSLSSSIAFAQEVAGEASGEAKPSFLLQMLPIFAVFFIMYFLMIRPQVKKQKKQAELVDSLKKGDQVLTSSGIFGTIEGLNEKFITLEVSQGVRIRVLRSHVGAKVQQQEGMS